MSVVHGGVFFDTYGSNSVFLTKMYCALPWGLTAFMKLNVCPSTKNICKDHFWSILKSTVAFFRRLCWRYDRVKANHEMKSEVKAYEQNGDSLLPVCYWVLAVGLEVLFSTESEPWFHFFKAINLRASPKNLEISHWYYVSLRNQCKMNYEDFSDAVAESHLNVLWHRQKYLNLQAWQHILAGKWW